eukprot:4462167-Pyramimonas_sp.AAC.1
MRRPKNAQLTPARPSHSPPGAVGTASAANPTVGDETRVKAPRPHSLGTTYQGVGIRPTPIQATVRNRATQRRAAASHSLIMTEGLPALPAARRCIRVLPDLVISCMAPSADLSIF